MSNRCPMCGTYVDPREKCTSAKCSFYEASGWKPTQAGTRRNTQAVIKGDTKELRGDPLADSELFTGFVAELRERLDAGEREYGDRSLQRPATDLVDEIRQELLDVCGWSVVLLARLERVMALTERAERPDEQEAGGEAEAEAPVAEPTESSVPTHGCALCEAEGKWLCSETWRYACDEHITQVCVAPPSLADMVGKP